MVMSNGVSSSMSVFPWITGQRASAKKHALSSLVVDFNAFDRSFHSRRACLIAGHEGL